MNVPCGGIHAGQRYTVQSSVIEIVLDRSDSMFISLRHRVYSLCSVRYSYCGWLRVKGTQTPRVELLRLLKMRQAECVAIPRPSLTAMHIGTITIEVL